MRQERVNRTAAEKRPCGCDLYVRQERVNRTAAEQSPCGCDLYVRQKRVKHTTAEQSPCGCDLYVRQKRVKRTTAERDLYVRGPEDVAYWLQRFLIICTHVFIQCTCILLVLIARLY